MIGSEGAPKARTSTFGGARTSVMGTTGSHMGIRQWQKTCNMDRAEIEKLTGRELDAAVLKYVFHNPHPTDENWWGCEWEWEGTTNRGHWVARRFSTNWQAMEGLIRKMHERDYAIRTFSHSTAAIAHVWSLLGREEPVEFHGYGDTLPVAVARASVLATSERV